MTDLPRLEGSVLIADDEEAICRGIKRVLTSRGAEVDMAHSGADALKRLYKLAREAGCIGADRAAAAVMKKEGQ